MSAWKKNAGRILHAGDSMALQAGGWRAKVNTDLIAAGYGYVNVGPLSDADGSFYAVTGTSIADEIAGGNLGAVVATARPFILTMNWGFNDVFFQGRTSTQALADLATLMDDCYTAAPWLRVVVGSIIRGDHHAAYAAQQPQADAFNAALAAFAVTQNAGGRHIAIAALSADPVRSDEIHPVVGATGYDLMGPPRVAAIVALKAA